MALERTRAPLSSPLRVATGRCRSRPRCLQAASADRSTTRGAVDGTRRFNSNWAFIDAGNARGAVCPAGGNGQSTTPFRPSADRGMGVALLRWRPNQSLRLPDRSKRRCNDSMRPTADAIHHSHRAWRSCRAPADESRRRGSSGSSKGSHLRQCPKGTISATTPWRARHRGHSSENGMQWTGQRRTGATRHNRGSHNCLPPRRQSARHWQHQRLGRRQRRAPLRGDRDPRQGNNVRCDRCGSPVSAATSAWADGPRPS